MHHCFALARSLTEMPTMFLRVQSYGNGYGQVGPTGW